MQTGTARKPQAGKPGAARRGVEAFRARLQQRIEPETGSTTLGALADKVEAAFTRYQRAEAEGHRTFSLVEADKERHPPFYVVWKSRIAALYNSVPDSGERKHLVNLRNEWDELIHERHGYRAASDEWNAAAQAFRKALKAFLSHPAKHPAEIALKLDVYKHLSERGEEQRETAGCAIQEVQENAPLLIDCIAADLLRLQP